MSATDSYPPPESRGGWRTALAPDEARDRAGVDVTSLEPAWALAAGLHDDSALLVARHGWLCFERYQGQVSARSRRDLHSCGKAFTCTAAGVLLGERPALFPRGLEQPVYNGEYLPPEHAPLHDERKGGILLGQLLSHTAGLRGNRGDTFTSAGPAGIEPPGPDGGFPDAVAFGHQPWPHRDDTTSAETLWCAPGAGYSYASAGPLIVGAMIRHLTGQEVHAYLAQRVLGPIGWEDWGWDQNPPEPSPEPPPGPQPDSPLAGPRHTKAQGGIRPRPRDALRFGYLLLRGGAWAGRQLVPPAHVAAMGRPSPYNPYPVDYGLQVRVNARGAAAGAPRDAFGPAGFADNYIYVVPSLDLVAVRVGGRRDAHLRQGVWHTLLDLIVAAVRD